MKLRLNIHAILAAVAVCARAEGAGPEHPGLHRRDLVGGGQQLAVAVDPQVATQAVQAPVVPQLAAAAPQMAVQPQIMQMPAVAGAQRFADTTQILIQAPSPAAASVAQALLPPALANPAAIRQALAAPAAAPALAPAVAGTVVADPATAPVYAQQQYYPAAAAAAPPLVQQLLTPGAGIQGIQSIPGLQAGLLAGSLPNGMILGNPFLPQALVPLDPAVSDLLATQAAAASSTTAAAAETADDESATAEESAEADEETPAPRRPRKAATKVPAKAVKAHPAAARKARAAASSNDDDGAEPAAEAADTLDADAADAADVGVRHTSRNARKTIVAGTRSSRGARKAAVRDEYAEAEADAADDVTTVRHKASAAAADDDDNAAADASSDALDVQSGYKRVGGAHLRSARGSLREEAAQAREEASWGARDAVLSEIRAEASSEAAQQASSELHLSVNTIIRDEEASANRIRESYETVRDYGHDSSQTVYMDDASRTRAGDERDQAYTTAGRYADSYGENTSTWDVRHAVSWANSHSYGGDEPQSLYRPNGAYSEGSYGHGASSYADSADESTGASDNTYTHTYGDNSYSHTYGDNSYTHTYGDNTYTHTYGDNSYSHTYGDNTYTHTYSDNSDSSSYSGNGGAYDEHSNGGEHASESQAAPYNFVNKHADSMFASDASAALSSPPASASAMSAPTESLRAVNDLDPLSYATQGCSFRSNLPLSVPPEGPRPDQSSIMIIGLPAQSTQPAVIRNVVPSTSTVMVTKLVTPAVKVVYASDSDDD
ncbi:hypothetical protein H4R19_002302 [Coemansia spiralis]|nr:hypothetical protein H4R19_002302 [Coemansia spiralis]